MCCVVFLKKVKNFTIFESATPLSDCQSNFRPMNWNTSAKKRLRTGGRGGRNLNEQRLNAHYKLEPAPNPEPLISHKMMIATNQARAVVPTTSSNRSSVPRQYLIPPSKYDVSNERSLDVVMLNKKFKSNNVHLTNESPSKTTQKLLNSLEFTPEKATINQESYTDGDVQVDFYNDEQFCNVSGEPVMKTNENKISYQFMDESESHSEEVTWQLPQHLGSSATEVSHTTNIGSRPTSGDFETWRQFVSENISSLSDSAVRSYLEEHLDLKRLVSGEAALVRKPLDCHDFPRLHRICQRNRSTLKKFF